MYGTPDVAPTVKGDKAIRARQELRMIRARPAEAKKPTRTVIFLKWMADWS
ncbi:hypothetical protein [Streptomyces sp. NPDC002328]|uniref:hypothetical protein n=1 Tax=Streptomyces sp. NPDC002328 TaxID=3364642 RepID=UPI00367A4686